MGRDIACFAVFHPESIFKYPNPNPNTHTHTHTHTHTYTHIDISIHLYTLNTHTTDNYGVIFEDQMQRHCCGSKRKKLKLD